MERPRRWPGRNPASHRRTRLTGNSLLWRKNLRQSRFRIRRTRFRIRRSSVRDLPIQGIQLCRLRRRWCRRSCRLYPGSFRSGACPGPRPNVLLSGISRSSQPVFRIP